MAVANSCAEFRIYPSRWHDALVNASHLLTLLFLLLVPLELWFRVGLIVALFVSFYINRIHYEQVNRCYLQPLGELWELKFPGFPPFRVACVPLYRCRWLVLLRLDGDRRRWYLPVFADSVNPGEFRRLCMLVSG